MLTIATKSHKRKSAPRVLPERGIQDGLKRTDKNVDGLGNGKRTARFHNDSIIDDSKNVDGLGNGKRTARFFNDSNIDDTNREACKGCGRLFKKGRGLKIHHTKSGCLKTKVQQRKFYKSEVEVTQDSNHSSDSSQVGPREATQIVAEDIELDSSPIEPNKTAEKESVDRKEEEMEIAVEEEVYKEVQEWIVKMEESNSAVGERKKKKKKKEEEKKNKDIRTWLVTEHNGKEVKDSRTVVVNVEGKEAQEKEEKMQDYRVVVKKQGKEQLSEKTSLRQGQKSKEVDIRNWFEEKEPVKEKVCKELGEQSGKDTRRVVKNDSSTVSSHINEGPDEEVLATHGLHLKRCDMKTLQGQNYLNDQIIDEYMRLVQQRNETHPELPKVIACTTFLYTQLKTFGLEEGCRRTRRWIKEDLTQKDFVLFPIHHNDHWSLVVAEPKRKVVHYLDSINGSRYRSAAPGRIRGYMERLHERKGEQVKYKIRIRKDPPLQENGVDCGVFTCLYAERLTRKAGMNFKQADIPQARERMMEELLQGRLQQEDDTSNRETQKEPDREKEKKGQQRPAKARKAQKKPERAKSEENKQRLPKARKAEAQKNGGAENTDRKERIEWPKASSQDWENLDETLSEILRAQSSAPENKAVVHPAMIYALCKERYGVKEEREKKKPKGPSSRQRRCTRLRKEINMLKQAYSEAAEEEKEAVKQLQEEKLKELRLAKRAESLRKKRKAFAKNCNAFLSQPFQFARNQLDPKLKGKLESSKEEVESFLQEVHGEKQDVERRCLEDTPEHEEPQVEYDRSVPSWHEFNRKLRKARNKSAPGPNGIPYLLYKRCPKVSRLLFGYLKGLWRKNVVSKAWRKAEGLFIPKEEGATEIGKFRTISLLNVEGKLFFGMKSDRLTQYVLANRYIDESVQKGGVPGVSGCLEHTSLLSQLIREAREGRKNLVVTWLDIANAYGSIPHSLIMGSLRKAHVPEEEVSLVESYYSDVQIRFSTKGFTTEWQKLEKGIVTGCTLSVILFSLAMTMLVASAKNETKGPKTESGQRQENARLFMDDIATTTENLVQTKHLLDNLARKLEGGGLEVRPDKCRSLVLIKGEISRRMPEINGSVISSVADKPIKYLGKIYNGSLNDREQTEETGKELRRNLKKLDRCRVPGKYKAWMLQHMVLPRLMWPLTIYQVPATKVTEMQRLITAKLKKWLGLPRSLSVECFYTTSGKLQLPFSDLEEEMKAAKARLLTTLEEAKDPCVSNAGIQVDGGRKADTAQSIKEAREKLKMEQIAGIPNRGREGLGMKPKKHFNSGSKTEKRNMIVEKVREAEEERRTVKMTGLAKQGSHMRWEVPARKLSPREVVMMPEDRLKFLVKSVYDLLPTPQNKSIWFGEEEARCRQCGENGSLTHILSGCKVALADGKYKWRHDQVLKEIALSVDEKRRKHNAAPGEKGGGKIDFIRSGEKKKKAAPSPLRSYLDGAGDWSLKVDLDNRLRVPERVSETNLRPDMLLISDSTKRMGIVELTVPSEERVEIAGEMKREKYQRIVQDGKERGWTVRVWAVEVGYRGFPAASMASFLKDIGLGGGERNRALRRIGDAAESGSRAIWRWSCM